MEPTRASLKWSFTINNRRDQVPAWRGRMLASSIVGCTQTLRERSGIPINSSLVWNTQCGMKIYGPVKIYTEVSTITDHWSTVYVPQGLNIQLVWSVFQLNIQYFYLYTLKVLFWLNPISEVIRIFFLLIPFVHFGRQVVSLATVF